MKPIQANIEIKNGEISQLENSRNGVTISDGDSEFLFEGCYALPGLCDTHCHVWGLGMLIHDPNLIGTKSAEECINIIKKHKPNRGKWYFGRGWNEQLWTSKAMPTKELLDEAFPDNPVFMYRIDGHAAWVNSKALELVGYGLNTENPAGGEILKDSNGVPNGITLDNANDAMFEIMPYYSDDYMENMILDALHDCASKGLTEVHDVDVDPRQVPIFMRLADEGKLPVRVVSYLSAQSDQYLKANLNPYKSNFFEIKGIKFFADGALGSYGAALLEPYSDKPETKGLILIDKNELFQKAKKGIELGFSIATHAIGDAAVRMVLDVYEELRVTMNIPDEIHLRIEHSQTVTKQDVIRYKKSNIIPAVQAIHCTSDAATMTEHRLGAGRLSTAYPWRSFLNIGVKILGGSDFPIESNDPLLGIEAFTKRIPNGENESWQPQEIISIEEALDAYTIDARREIGISGRGELKIGQSADLTILKNGDFQNQNEIIATFCGGKATFLK